MEATSGCVDVLIYGGLVSDSGVGGDGGDGGGGGDGFGEWSRVTGLGEVWLSGGLSGWWFEFTSKFISTSVGVVAGRSAWGTGSAGAIVEDRCLVTLLSLSGCLVKVDVMVAMIGGCVPHPV